MKVVNKKEHKSVKPQYKCGCGKILDGEAKKFKHMIVCGLRVRKINGN